MHGPRREPRHVEAGVGQAMGGLGRGGWERPEAALPLAFLLPCSQLGVPRVGEMKMMKMAVNRFIPHRPQSAMLAVEV